MAAKIIELKARRRDPNGAPEKRTMWAWTIATFFGTGLLKPGPGTWASAFTVGLAWLWTRSLTPAHAHLAIAVACVVATLVGIPAATRVEREFGSTDPGLVVIDEVAGQLMPLILAPLNWKYLFASLILFRGFDIVKPPPVRWFERLPAGYGIMVDDLAAGAYALLVIAVIAHFRLF